MISGTIFGIRPGSAPRQRKAVARNCWPFVATRATPQPRLRAGNLQQRRREKRRDWPFHVRRDQPLPSHYHLVKPEMLNGPEVMFPLAWGPRRTWPQGATGNRNPERRQQGI